MGAHLPRVKTGVVGAPGTGTITLGDPIRDPLNGDCLSIAEAGGANGTVYSYILIDGGNFAEGEGAWASSGNTLARDAAEKRWNGTNYVTGKLSLTSAAIVLLTPRAKDLVASGIPFSPAGSVAATTVQAAIEEVAAESAPGRVPLSAGNFTLGTAEQKLVLPTTYRRFELIIQGASPDVSVRPLAVDFSRDNGATFISTASAYYWGHFTQKNTAPAGGTGAADTKILLTPNGVYTSADGANLTVDIDCAPSRATRLNWRGSYYDNAATEVGVFGHGTLLGTGRATDLRLFWSGGGNFETNVATYALYGVRHA